MLNTSLIQLKNTMNKDEFDLKVREILDFIEDMSGRQVFYKTVFDEEQSECSHDVP